MLRCTGDLPKINGSHPLPRRGSGEPALKKRINVLQNGGTGTRIMLSPARAEIFLGAEPTQPPAGRWGLTPFTFWIELHGTRPERNATTADIAWTIMSKTSLILRATLPGLDAWGALRRRRGRAGRIFRLGCKPQFCHQARNRLTLAEMHPAKPIEPS